jgi:beta-galactosidase
MQMFYTTRRHPSVIAYFLADKSANGIALYESYIALKAVAGDRPVIYLDGGKEWNSDYHK